MEADQSAWFYQSLSTHRCRKTRLTVRGGSGSGLAMPTWHLDASSRGEGTAQWRT